MNNKYIYDMTLLDKNITQIASTSIYSYEEALVVVLSISNKVLQFSMAGALEPLDVVHGLFNGNHSTDTNKESE